MGSRKIQELFCKLRVWGPWWSVEGERGEAGWWEEKNVEKNLKINKKNRNHCSMSYQTHQDILSAPTDNHRVIFQWLKFQNHK